jgi:hypothetical protein
MNLRSKGLHDVLGFLKFPKPTTRKQEKAKEDREEARVVKEVRALCVERDGHCRLQWLLRRFPTCPLEPCRGPSEWGHLEGHRRFETMGKPPEERHATAWTAMFCQGHHHAYDKHDFDIEQITERGADGALRLRVNGRTYEEIR